MAPYVISSEEVFSKGNKLNSDSCLNVMSWLEMVSIFSMLQNVLFVHDKETLCTIRVCNCFLTYEDLFTNQLF